MIMRYSTTRMYIIKKGTFVIVGAYPHTSQNMLSVQENKCIAQCFQRVHLTKKLHFFSKADLVFKGNVILDPTIRKSNLTAFASTGFYGFNYRFHIFMVAVKDISNLKTSPIEKKPTPKIIPFSNINTKIRITFDEWLKEINYEW